MVALLVAALALGASPGDPRVHLREGIDYYDRGEYDAAIESFQVSYSLAPAPGLLFNIAQAYRLKGSGSCSQAAEYYERFLTQSAPGDANRALALSRLREARQCVERQAAKAPPAFSPPAQPDSRPSRAPLLAVGLGVASLAAGTTLYVASRITFDRQAETVCGAAGTCLPSSWAAASRRQQLGIGLMAGGLAGVAAGALWHVLQSRGGTKSALRMGGPGIQMGISF